MAEDKGLEKPKAPEKQEALKQKATPEDIKLEGIEARNDLKNEVFLSKLDKNNIAEIEKAFKLEQKLTPEILKNLQTNALQGVEGKKNGTLMLLFGEKIEKDKRRVFNYKEFEGAKFNKSMAAGDKISVDFKGNTDAYWNIGAGDMLPETVRKIRVIDDKGNERVSTMRQGLRSGFYDAKGYIPVFDNYTIEVVEVWDDKQLAEYKKNSAKHEKEELANLDRIYKENPGASRGKLPELEKVFEKPDLAKLDETMDKAMADLGVDASFKPVLYSFIKHESAFKMGANPGTSSAYGLFQLLESNWKWTYRDLAHNPKFENVAYGEFKNSLEGQVYSGLLYFKKMDVTPVERALGRRVDPNNMRDNYLLYVAHHEGPGGLRYFLENGRFKSGVDMIGGYAWKVANGAEFYKQEIARMAAEKNAPQQTREAQNSDIGEVAFMGDSLTKGMELYKGIDGAGTFGIGGQNTGQMLKRFEREVVGGGYKKVVILAGVNNLTSDWTPEKVERDLKKMYEMARAADIKVVACTLPPWGKFIENYPYKKFAVERGLTAEKMQTRTNELNNWIRSQEGGLVDKVVDLYKYMGDESDSTRLKYDSGDGLHPGKKGAKLMAEIIKREAEIG